MKSIYLHSYKAQIKKKYKLLRNDIMKQPAQTHSQTNKSLLKIINQQLGEDHVYHYCIKIHDW